MTSGCADCLQIHGKHISSHGLDTPVSWCLLHGPIPEAISSLSDVQSCAVVYKKTWRHAVVRVNCGFAGLLSAAWLGVQMLTSCRLMKQMVYQSAVRLILQALQTANNTF